MTATRPETTVGVTGQRWRASVNGWGAVTPWDDGGRRTLDWYVAADDRWHRPEVETAVRQRRLDGTPVVETRVRIPEGDAVQRVWSVATAGGMTIVEVDNDSPLPIAVAFCGLPVLTERPPAAVPIEGIDLPAEAIVMPVGHRTSIRVAIPHGAEARGSALSPTAAPDAAAVARGWAAVVGRAGRVDVPDEALAEALIAARCDLLLDGPVDVATDPTGFVLDVAELVRCGEPADRWLPEVVAPIETLARSADTRLAAVLDAGERIAIAADDAVALGDLGRLRARVAPEAAPVGPLAAVRRTGSVGRFVHEVERQFADGGNLLAAGIPPRWYGSGFEVHGVPTSGRSSVSYAVRWHGERPAVLWEQVGEPQRLTARAVDRTWSTDEVSGEALWAPPARSAAPALAVTVLADDEPPQSLS